MGPGAGSQPGGCACWDGMWRLMSSGRTHPSEQWDCLSGSLLPRP